MIFYDFLEHFYDFFYDFGTVWDVLVSKVSQTILKVWDTYFPLEWIVSNP